MSFESTISVRIGFSKRRPKGFSKRSTQISRSTKKSSNTKCAYVNMQSYYLGRLVLELTFNVLTL
jgi:hypothetical protein